MAAAAQPLDPLEAPRKAAESLLQRVGQPAALQRLEDAVGRDFAHRLVAALSHCQGRRGQSAL